MENMRLFIGLPIPEAGRKELVSYQQTLKTHAWKGSFSDMHNLHLTIVFLGDTDRIRIPLIEQVLKTVQSPVIPLSFHRYGAFRKPDGDVAFLRPDDDAAVRDIYRQATIGLKAQGFSFEDKPFKAHLTLGRNVRWEAGYQVPDTDISFICKEIVLFHSHRVDGLLTYSPLFCQPFSG